jgi:hypothetical protein
MGDMRKKRSAKGKARKAKLKDLTTTGMAKTKKAAKFIYDNRDKIQEAVKLVAAVVAVASEVLGKPGKPRRRK